MKQNKLVLLCVGLMICFSAHLNSDVLGQEPPGGGNVVSRSWTGAVNGNWSNPNNWSPAGVPQNGESLYFRDDSNSSMVNDLTGLVIDGMVFADNVGI